MTSLHALHISMLCTLCLLASNMQGQSVKKVTFDFSARHSFVAFEPVETIEKGDQFVLEIDCVNLNLYRVLLDAKDTLASTPVTFPTFGSFGVDVLSGLVGAIGPITTTVGVLASVLPDLEAGDSLNTISFYNEKIKAFNSSNKSGRLPLFTVRDSIVAVIKERMKNEQVELNSATARVKQQKARLDDLIINTGLAQARHRIEFAADRSKIVVDEKALELRSILSVALKLREELSALQASSAKRQKSYGEFAEEHKKTIEADAGLTKDNKALIGAQTELAATLDKAIAQVSPEKVNELVNALVILENNAGMKYTSLPMPYNGDKVRLKVRIEPLKPEYNLQTYTTTFIYPSKDPSYFGVSAAFYGAGLYNEAFSAISSTVDSSTTYALKEESVTKNEIGAAALFTVGTKTEDAGCFGIHGVVGPGVSITDKVRPRLLLGGGFSLGKEHMVMFNGGVITGFVDRRSAAFSKDDGYTGEPGGATVTKLDGSWFASIGYLFKF